MASTILDLIPAIVAGALVYGVLRHSTTTQSFRQKPQEEQDRARRIFRWGPFVATALYLVIAKAESVRSSLPILVYISLWALSLWMIWYAFRVGVKKDYRYLGSSSHAPLSYIETIAPRLALVSFTSGVSIAALLLCLVIFQIPLVVSAALFSLISLLTVVVIKRIRRACEA